MLSVMTGIPFIGEAAFMLVEAGVGLIVEADGAGAAASWEQPARPIAAKAAAAVTRIELQFFMDFSLGRGGVVVGCQKRK
jgi:hypothetical protein